MTPEERFFQHVAIPPNPFIECWEWQSWKQVDGYGRFRLGGRGSSCKQAHRFMWELFNERPIPKKLEIDHTCENRACVNPLHLAAVTPQMNKSQRFGRRQHRNFLTEEIDA